MTDLNEATYFIGVEISRNREKRTITLSQSGYIKKVLKHYGMEQARKVDTPYPSKIFDEAPDNYLADPEMKATYQQITGHIGYATIHTRPDMAIASNRMSRHLVNPTDEHIGAAKHALRYLGTHPDRSIKFDYSDSEILNIKAYSDSAYADGTNSRSTSAYLFTANGAPLSWATTLQKTVALSSCEAEYYGLGDAMKEALWLQGLLIELRCDGPDTVPMRLFADNRGAIDLSHNPEFHKRTKHVAVKWHFVRQHVESGEAIITWVPTDKMKADGMTKPLDKVKHAAFLDQLNM